MLDPSAGRVNGYAAPGGASAEGLAAFCATLRRLAPPAAATISAYDPVVDADGRAGQAALAVVEALVG